MWKTWEAVSFKQGFDFFPWKKMFLTAADRIIEDDINRISQSKGNICGIKKYPKITLTWQVNIIN